MAPETSHLFAMHAKQQAHIGVKLAVWRLVAFLRALEFSEPK
jgi:hypothetical protein